MNRITQIEFAGTSKYVLNSERFTSCKKMAYSIHPNIELVIELIEYIQEANQLQNIW